MAGENTTSLNSELFANLVTAAEFAAYENSVARQLVKVFDAPVNAGKVLQVPIWASITAQNITDESAATAANTNTSSASITLSEHVVYSRVTDMLRDSAYGDVMAQLGDQSGRAIAESLDTQVFALFSSNAITQAVGTANSAVTADNILQAVATLRANKLTGPFYAVLAPKQAYRIKKELANVGGVTMTDVGNEVLRTGFVAQLDGCQIFESSLVPTSGNNAFGCVFASSAFGHGMRGGIAMEEQRQAAARATDIVLTAVAGASILQASHAVEVVGLNTIS
jgi:N4-gp56 family major capsid protein